MGSRHTENCLMLKDSDRRAASKPHSIHSALPLSSSAKKIISIVLHSQRVRQVNNRASLEYNNVDFSAGYLRARGAFDPEAPLL